MANLIISPSTVTGSHFSDFLICPHRAWLQYHANPKDQVKDPAYLIALQHEGLEYEQYIYKIHFKNAIKIPAIKDNRKRHNMTVEAMKNGEPIILQAYLQFDEKVGVIDFLELLGPETNSNVGHLYRVGEIKSAATLSTAHAMQAAWYTELLKHVQGVSLPEARFILKNETEQMVDLKSIEYDYNVVKDKLLNLRLSGKPPGPFLIRACSSCRWRGICMPIIKAGMDLSLLPYINRQRTEKLNNCGVIKWHELNNAHESNLYKTGFTEFEVDQIMHAIKCLKNNTPPLRYPLKKGLLDGLTVVAPEIPELASQRKLGKGLFASAFYYEAISNNKVEKITVNINDGKMTADLTPIEGIETMGIYGSTDIGVVLQLAKSSNYKIKKYIDIFMLIDNMVHVPSIGTELDELFAYITGTDINVLSGKQRVYAIREVIDWVAKSI